MTSEWDLAVDSPVLNFSDKGVATLKLTNKHPYAFTYKALCTSPAIRMSPVGLVEKNDFFELRFTKDPAVKLPSDIRLEVQWRPKKDSTNPTLGSLWPDYVGTVMFGGVMLKVNAP